MDGLQLDQPFPETAPGLTVHVASLEYGVGLHGGVDGCIGAVLVDEEIDPPGDDGSAVQKYTRHCVQSQAVTDSPSGKIVSSSPQALSS